MHELDRKFSELGLKTAQVAAPSGRADQDAAFYIHGIIQIKEFQGMRMNVQRGPHCPYHQTHDGLAERD